MKCEVCLPLLEEYIDGELWEAETAPVSAHLITCAGCATEFEALTADREIYARFDRELVIAPMMWNEIAARTIEAGRAIDSGPLFRLREWFALPSLGWSFAAAIAILVFAAAMGIVYFRPPQAPPEQQANAWDGPKPIEIEERKQPAVIPQLPAIRNNKLPQSPVKAVVASTARQSRKPVAADQSDVLFSDVAYSAVEERDTQQHIEQAQNLLRSVRNIEISEDDTEIDVSYEKALSRRLLNENIVLRRDAEMSGKFPAKTLLSELEPFLIDIANLPDNPAPDDLRVLKERVLKTEIGAALRGY